MENSSLDDAMEKVRQFPSKGNFQDLIQVRNSVRPKWVWVKIWSSWSNQTKIGLLNFDSDLAEMEVERRLAFFICSSREARKFSQRQPWTRELLHFHERKLYHSFLAPR